MKKKAWILWVAACSAITITGCGQDTSEQESNSDAVLMIEDSSEITEETTEEATKETEVTTTDAVKSITKSSSTGKSTEKSTGTTTKTTATTKKAVNGSTGANAVNQTEAEESSEEAENEVVEEENAEAEDNSNEEVVQEEEVIDPADLTLVLGEDCTQYVTQIPYISSSEGISCMGEGYDRTYDYGDYIIYTFADYEGTGDYVQEIDLVTDAYSTYAGIHVGSTREEVEATYGTTEDGLYASSEGGYLSFQYDGDTVSLVMYCLNG